MTTGDSDTGGIPFPEDLAAVDPVAAVMLADACRAISAYPELLPAGVLFSAAERVPGGWQVVCPGDPLPQGARESLATHLYNRAAGSAVAQEFYRAAHALERGPLDDLVVDGRRFRIIRIERFLRTGADGPEPPRPTDHDPRRTVRDRPVPVRPHDFIADSQPTPDAVTAELLCQYLDAAARAGSEPAEPFLSPVMLAPAFTVAERAGEQWIPTGRQHGTPQEARDSLAAYFRHVLPALEGPDKAEVQEYAEAADRLEDRQGCNGVIVAGRRFRIIRFERIVLVGPEGPEMPRATDYDGG